ncbi:hypothetical protein HAINFHK1212_0623, partial [Haemophilus influenzae HK1212]
ENHFTTVIDWISTVFEESPEKEMKGLEWGRLYATYGKTAYNPTQVAERVKALYSDPYVKNRKGIFEYILGGEQDKRLLDVRVFDEATKKATYKKQTEQAEKEGKSNCPLCAIHDNANKTKIEDLKLCDQIFVMQRGEIVQQGKFTELQHEGFFAELLAQRQQDIQ